MCTTWMASLLPRLVSTQAFQLLLFLFGFQFIYTSFAHLQLKKISNKVKKDDGNDDADDEEPAEEVTRDEGKLKL